MGANNMKILNLKGNRLIVIGTEFSHLPALEELNLSENRFVTLEQNSFAGLKNLRKLHMERITTLISLHVEAFNDLENLSVLSFEGNANLKSFPSTVFSPLVALEEINLSLVPIEEVLPVIFQNNSELKSISLTHGMTEFNPDTFSHLIKLEFFKIRNSFSFEIVNAELFANNVNLKTLIFNNCNITELSSDSFEKLINLEEIDLGYNRIELPDNIFEKNVNLKILKLTSTGIVGEMNAEILKTLTKLEVLHVDANTIRIIDSNLFVNNPELIDINFTSNRINATQSTFLENQKKLEILDFNGNVCVNRRFSGIVDGDLSEIIPLLNECFLNYELSLPSTSTSTIIPETTTSGSNLINISKYLLIGSFCLDFVAVKLKKLI